MTTKELYNRITLGTCVSGQFTVAIEYRGEEYTCKSNNTLAYDAIRFDADPKESHYTYKQALMSLWRECKAKNNLK